MTLTPPDVTLWSDLDENRAADGINVKWIDCNDEVWHIAGFNQGAEGGIITGAIRGMVHRPFKVIRHEPAYAAPRFERTVDELREVSFPITLMSDSKYGWFDTETKWWNGCRPDRVGWLCVFTRPFGEYYIPMMLGEAVEDELESDPTDNDDNSKTWLIKLTTDGDTNWQVPDLRPNEWKVKLTDPVKQIKRDEGVLAPKINVRSTTLRVANRGTEPAWPIYTVTAPGRVWLPDGLSGKMIRVPQLFDGEHVTIDTNPEHKIVISATDPVENWLLRILSNVELLQWLGINAGQRAESVLERFHGQGFTQAIPPNTVANLPIYHSQVGAHVSVRLPQRYERAIS